MTATLPPSRAASVSDLLESATLLFRATLLKCLPMAMLAVFAAQLPNFYWVATGHAPQLKIPVDQTYQVLALCGWVVELQLVAMLLLRQRAMLAGAPLNAGAEMRAALRRLPVVVLTVLLAVFSVAAGIALLVVPGLFLMVCYLLLLPVVLFEGAGPYSALVRCVQLARPLWWKLCAALVIGGLVVLICALVFAALISVVAAVLAGQGPVFSAIVSAASVGLFAVAMVFMSSLVLVLHSAASSSA